MKWAIRSMDGEWWGMSCSIYGWIKDRDKRHIYDTLKSAREEQKSLRVQRSCWILRCKSDAVDPTVELLAELKSLIAQQNAMVASAVKVERSAIQGIFRTRAASVGPTASVYDGLINAANIVEYRESHELEPGKTSG